MHPNNDVVLLYDIEYPRVIQSSNGRWISYWKSGISIAMLEYRRVYSIHMEFLLYL